MSGLAETNSAEVKITKITALPTALETAADDTTLVLGSALRFYN
jgi:hypothetical protein